MEQVGTSTRISFGLADLLLVATTCVAIISVSHFHCMLSLVELLEHSKVLLGHNILRSTLLVTCLCRSMANKMHIACGLYTANDKFDCRYGLIGRMAYWFECSP